MQADKTHLKYKDLGRLKEKEWGWGQHAMQTLIKRNLEAGHGGSRL